VTHRRYGISKTAAEIESLENRPIVARIAAQRNKYKYHSGIAPDADSDPAAPAEKQKTTEATSFIADVRATVIPFK